MSCKFHAAVSGLAAANAIEIDIVENERIQIRQSTGGCENRRIDTTKGLRFKCLNRFRPTHERVRLGVEPRRREHRHFPVARRKDPHENLTSIDALTLARIDRHDWREEGEGVALRPR